MKYGKKSLMGLIMVTFPLIAMKNPIFVDLTIEVETLGSKVFNNMHVLLQENPKSQSSNNNENLRAQIASLVQKTSFYNDEIKKLKNEVRALKKSLEMLDKSRYEEIEQVKRELYLCISKSCVQKK